MFTGITERMWVLWAPLSGGLACAGTWQRGNTTHQNLQLFWTDFWYPSCSWVFVDWLDFIVGVPPLFFFFFNEPPLMSFYDIFPLTDIFVHIWPALQGEGRSSTSFTGQCAICDGAVLKKKKKIFQRGKYLGTKNLWNKSSKRDNDSIMPTKILIYSVTKGCQTT